MSLPRGVGITVAVVAITAPAVSGFMPTFNIIGYNVASKIIAKLDALGTTSDKIFPTKNTNGTKIYTDLIPAIGLINALTVISFACIFVI